MNTTGQLMRLSHLAAIAGVFLLALLLAILTARVAVFRVEESTRHAVRERLYENGLIWAEVDTDGLQVYLAGTAPSEAVRFKALSAAGSVVDAARVIDQMVVEETAAVAPPRFSIEILRNDSGVSLIGLVPASISRKALVGDIRAALKGETVADLLESADYPVPKGWSEATGYAMRALRLLGRTKISVDAEHMHVIAMAESAEEKAKVEAELRRRRPENVALTLEISAPRPVVTPYTLRFVIDGEGARFDACTADTQAARERILAAARAAGLEGEADCLIGLGVPSPRWSEAVELAIAALGKLGGGVVTFTDADVSLLAREGTPQALFDDVVGGLDTALPEVFVLTAVLPEPPDQGVAEVPEFVATLSPEGLVQLRGRIKGGEAREMLRSFAVARFSVDAIDMKARVAEGLPEGWTYRVMAGLQALSYLSNGVLRVTPDDMALRGWTGDSEAGAKISGFLAERLGEGAKFSLDVRYRKALDPVASLPTPQECQERINAILARQKITFEPGSARIDVGGARIINDIADVLKECGEITIEIGGHTDSQGREVMNQQLSQARAQAVLNELRMRGVLTGSITAVGYGESRPVADNGTEEGREANRRIEFRVILPESEREDETGLDTGADPVEERSEVPVATAAPEAGDAAAETTAPEAEDVPAAEAEPAAEADSEERATGEQN